MRGHWIVLNACPVSLRWSFVSALRSIAGLNWIYGFASVEPSLHLRDKSYSTTLYNAFVIQQQHKKAWLGSVLLIRDIGQPFCHFLCVCVRVCVSLTGFSI
jgi:hypothetical protein